MNGFKTSLSREKFDRYAIDIGQNQPQCPHSEARPKEKKKLKKKKSKININLIERAKKRD